MQTLIQTINIIFIFAIAWWIWKRETITKMRKFFWPALAAKFSAGILVGVLYAIFYASSDTFFFFDSAIQLSQQARVDFREYLNFLFSQSDAYYAGEDRTIFFIKLTSIFALLTFDNYWICALYFSFLSFLAAWKLTKFIWVEMPTLGIAAAAAFLFFPSCVFWTSGILKESLAMTALFYLATVFLHIWLRKKVHFIHVIWVLLALWITWNLKYYYLGLFLAATITTLVSRKIIEVMQVKKFGRECAIWFLVFTLSIVAVSFIHPNFSFQRVANVLIENHNSIIRVSNPDDVIHFNNLSANWASVAANAPWAILSGFFRPFIWEANTFLKIIISIENLTLLLVSILSMRLLLKVRYSPYRLLVLAALMYCFMLCVFLTISTPNFGTLARLRIGFLPFFILLLASQPVITRPLARLFNVPLNNLLP